MVSQYSFSVYLLVREGFGRKNICNILVIRMNENRASYFC